MELKNLNTFLQIVESGSFTAAAQISGYTQSTVSFQISQLEKELNCKLFDRVGRTITLTEKGILLRRHALSMNNSMQSLLEDFKADDRIRGQIRVVSSDSICERLMKNSYNEFYSNYPEIKCIFSTANTEEMIDILRHNHADVILTLDSHVHYPDLIIAKEAPIPVHFAASASSPLAGRHLHIEDLLEYPFLLTEKGMSYRKILDDELSKRGLLLDPVMEHGRTDIIASLVENSPFITYLPDFVTEKKVKSGRLVYLDVEGFELNIWEQLLYHKDKWISKALDAFIAFAKDAEFR